MKKKEPEKFEDALARLEDIVRKLETGELPLEDSLKVFEEGIQLSQYCQQKLDEAERRVEALIADQGGNLKRESFTPEEE